MPEAQEGKDLHRPETSADTGLLFVCTKRNKADNRQSFVAEKSLLYSDGTRLRCLDKADVRGAAIDGKGVAVCIGEAQPVILTYRPSDLLLHTFRASDAGAAFIQREFQRGAVGGFVGDRVGIHDEEVFKL